MASSENAVREAAAKLHDAIVQATAEGYRITWPADAAGLTAIAVSETAKVKPEPATPAANPGRPSRPSTIPQTEV